MDLRRSRRTQDTSPRHLVFRHGRRLLQRLGGKNTNDDPEQIQPGEERLFSSYVPGLEAGLHEIKVEQSITASSYPNLNVSSYHNFNVVAPRFSLPEGTIYSVYPPPGHADRPECLPHVVFTDPTLPWERVASWNSERVNPLDYNHNRVPWLAVLLFTPDELHVAPDDLAAIVSNTDLKSGVQQSTNKTINILASEAKGLNRTCNCVPYTADSDESTVRTDAILIRSQLYKALFQKYDQNGNPDSSQKTGEVYPFRYLSHLRQIHMDGMAGIAASESDDHVFSVIVCPRTGPLAISKPITLIAHLVNIEMVEGLQLPTTQEFVAMSSLHSWQYTCLPPDSFDVAYALSHLDINLLEPPLSAGDKVKLGLRGLVGLRLSGRLVDGFSLARYRVQTGETTAAFMRGPLTPTTINPSKDANWPVLSTTGANLQILDQQVNIMDITYSAAWQLGRVLALADQAFVEALARVRKQIFDIAMNNAQIHVLRSNASNNDVASPYKSRIEIAKTIGSSVQQLAHLAQKTVLQNDPNGMVHRWFRHVPPPPNLKYNGNEIDAIIDDFLPGAASQVASSVDGDGTQPYNEFNKPYSTDWAIVLKWVMDRYFMVNVPPHYLVTDASCLPLESIRFFRVDEGWISAMIDGGLSVANHLDREDDRLRVAIKGAINNYRKTAIPDLNYTPSIPTYGFFLRSELVNKFPDIVVDIEPGPQLSGSPPILLRHEIVDHNLMLCLLSEAPSKPEFTTLYLREPPHQQFFAAARTLDSNHIEVDYKKIYTTKGKEPGTGDVIARTFTRGTSSADGSVFIWQAGGVDIHMLNTENFALDLYRTLRATLGPNAFTETCPTAALMGLQLNEPCWQLKLSSLMSNEVASTENQQTPGLLPMPSRKSRTHRPSRPFSRPQIACDPHPPFNKRNRLSVSQSNSNLVYPYYRLPGVDSSLWPPELSNLQFDNAPQFQYGIYPVGGNHGQEIKALPEKQDLVFSIVYIGGAQTWDMKQLEIYVPFGPTMAGPLMDYYQGPGPAMLSNLRFNVWYADNTRNCLVFVLQPRSTKGDVPTVPTHRIQEMSFTLPGVVLHQYQQSTAVRVKVQERYTSQDVPNVFDVSVGPSS